MRVILFGAGASYGSGDVAPRTPPLGRDLFMVLQRLYSHWRQVPADISALFRKDFELGMEKLINDYGHAIAPLMQEMAIFFSIFHISQGAKNRYVSLLDAAQDRRDVIWSTLNYECILETAATIRGKAVGYFAEPSDDMNALPVWKLHGSCNFQVLGMAATRGVSFSTPNVAFGGGIKPINPSMVPSVYSGNTALFPAMALFARGKPLSMSPGPIQNAQARWAQHVQNADRVLVVGVNPNIEDKHIWEPIADTVAPLAYVGSHSCFQDWSGSNRNGRDSSVLGETWEEAEGEAIDFLLG